METQRKRALARRLVGLSLLVLAATAISSTSYTVKDACADGTCCWEVTSICNIGGTDQYSYYKKACDGSCTVACNEE
jgi:hypothetical protein